MIIQCGACGFLKNIPHEGTPEEIEQNVADTIEEGWRYVKNYDGYICPSCRENGGLDKLEVGYDTKVIPESKTRSYKVLLKDMMQLLLNLKRLDEGLPLTESANE